MKSLLLPALSFGYRNRRAAAIRGVYARQKRENRPQDLEEVVELGDAKLKRLSPWVYTFPIPKGIGIDFHDLHFPSPLTLAAFKDDLSIMDIWMCLGLGGACIKTVMKEPRQGNTRPRLQEVTELVEDELGDQVPQKGLINAMGLPGHGVEGKIQELRTTTIFAHQRPIGLSFGGSSLEEYICVFDKLNEYIISRNVPHYFEINVSCPNTPEGQQMMRHPELLQDLLTHIAEQAPEAVVGIKLSPDTEDRMLKSLTETMRASINKPYVNIGNTKARTCEEVGLPRTAISLGKGGLSGPALYGRTRRMVKLVAQREMPIIATGGIDSAEKVTDLQSIAGFYQVPLLVGMATAVVQDMYCVPRINKELAKLT